ncbi:tripartite motif-containing protein 16-like [Sinocyclocheilus rhinocerous]|uniref:tripartite motif-containing protein 16-like n=1 Tax=Sinocyclocheilus rhinocerous TaxID=307959 RepID=UPI0007B9A324|nr:PREDICTED: tripartite motif-containing protein 16-like [Sinocyclocheilus rhinocerous]
MALRSVSRRGAKRFRVKISKTRGNEGGEVLAWGLAHVFHCWYTQGPWCPSAGMKKTWEDRVLYVWGLCSETLWSVSDVLYTYPGLVSVSPGCFQSSSPLSQLGLLLHGLQLELHLLSHTQDHIQFLQSFQSLSESPESTDVNEDLFSSLVSSDALRESVHQLRDKLEDFCKEELKKISDRVTFTNIVPRTRNDFLQYSHQLSLDLNTVNKRLRLSESNRVIKYTDANQSYPGHPDRFYVYPQVLCRESVCGRCYWEIEWSGFNVFGVVRISVSYKSISRKGQGYECGFGYNDQSWSMICRPSSYSFIHNNIKTDLSVEFISRRIGVFVDSTERSVCMLLCMNE